MKKLFATSCALAFALSLCDAGIAWAQPSPETLAKVSDLMTEADLNRDGKTSRAELNQHRAQMFAKLDRNEDGVIEQKDAPKILLARRKFMPAFEQAKSIFDSNNDERVTLDEWNRADPDVFAMLDSNEDGLVTRSELPTPK